MAFARAEKEGALKNRVPMYGYAQLQLGLRCWPEGQRMGTQFFGVEYEGKDCCELLQYGESGPISLQKGLPLSLQVTQKWKDIRQRY